MDLDLLYLYLEPDSNENINYPFLYNSEYSYKTFVKNLKNIFTRKINIYNPKPNVNYYLEMYDVNITNSDPSFSYTLFNSTSYDLIIEYKMSIFEEEITQSGIKRKEISIKRQNNIHQTKIPSYVCYKGLSPLNTPGPINENIFGGFFIVNKGMRKFMGNRRDLINTNIKYRKKDKVNRVSFNSIPSRYDLNNSNVQYLKLELSGLDKLKFDIQSTKTILPCNVIILIRYLTNLTLDEVKHNILQVFNDTIKMDSNFIFNKVKEQLKEYILETEELSDPNIEYKAIMNYMFERVKIYSKNNYKKTNNDVQQLANLFNELINNFLPHLTNKVEKGLYLISIVRQSLMAIFQPDITPSRDHLIGKRVSPIGYIFEETIINTLNNIIKELKENIKKKDSVTLAFANINFDQKMTGIFSNIFNMKDNLTKKIIKPSTGILNYSDIHIPNLVIHGGGVVLTKALENRNIEPSSISFEDIVDTPDKSATVGLVKRHNITSRLTYYTFDQHKKLFDDLKEFILDLAELDYKNKPIICSIVDQSEYPITFITEEQCTKIITTLKKYKRNNYKNFQYVGIEKVPVYVFDEHRQCNLPTNNTFQLKLHISCKRYYKPFFIIEDGKAAINSLPKDVFQKYKDFSSFIKDYPDVIEFLDPCQVTYSNICVDLETFNSMPLELRKKYDYIDLPSCSNFGLVAASTFDLGRMAGVRSTFAMAQQKQVLLQMNPNAYNKFESGSALLNPIERPCITNTILEKSGASKFGKGHHVLVGFFSYIDNIEDALVFRKSSLDRGLLDVITLTTFKSTLLNSQLNVPKPQRTNHSYSKLSETGLPLPMTVLTKDDAIHKKVNLMYKRIGEEEMDVMYDISENYNNLSPGRVERTEKTGTDNISINILTSSYKPGRPGDKFVNQGAQKGTMGVALEDHELPRTKDGLIPDIIINSVSIVGRQTFSLYIQAILTNLFANNPVDENGKFSFREYPVFTNVNIENVIKEIKEEYSRLYPNLTPTELDDKMFGNYDVYNIYGQKYEEKMMICPLMYNRNVQTSIDNISVRNGGKLNKLGVPVSGKKKGGGQKNGEMEMDLTVAHGAANILQENTQDVESINVYTYMCTNCSTPATKETINGKVRWYCIPCKNKDLITEIKSFKLSQAFKLCKELLRCRGVDFNLIEKDPPVYYHNMENN